MVDPTIFGIIGGIFTATRLIPQTVKAVMLKAHKILMLHQDLLPNEKGYFRNIPIYIGDRCGVSPELIRPLLEDWCEDIKSSFRDDDIKADHVQYEIIHPFVDGNGRTGRMFMNWQRLKVGLPILIIKESEKYEYYKWFEEFSE